MDLCEVRTFEFRSLDPAGSWSSLSYASASKTVTTLAKAGRYDLREEIGRGAMGVVFHGFDPVIGRDVAVKTLRLSEAGTGLSREELVGRFQTEARAAGLLAHPNIVVIFDAGEEDGLFYITMEFVEGRSLQSVIDARQPFPVPRVLKLMEQVCSALDFAHQHNVVHRDIKPANLMLTSDDVVKITDFGTAKILQFGTAQTAHVMGTPSYMSPEQVKGKPVDGRSDIFSMGVILYELMTGEKPFPGQNITTVIYKIINEQPIPPRSLDSSIHPGLSAVITRALAKEPADRFQSCHELLSALKNYHDMTAAEPTVRFTPANTKPSAASPRPSVQPPRVSAFPVAPKAAEPELPVPLFSPIVMVDEPPKHRGGWLLTLLLLGIIGYAGYRVYPPALDLWQRTHEEMKRPVTLPKPEPAPADSSAPAAAAAAADTTSAKSDALFSDPPLTQVPVTSPAPAESAAPVNAAPPSTPAASPAPPAKAAPHSTPPETSAAPAKAAEAASPAAASAVKSATQPKLMEPPVPTAAQVFESKLRSDLSKDGLSSRVNIHATANALTLSGSLTIAEHRALMTHLRVVPSGVRIIDDIDLSGDAKSAPAQN
jgi:serine/threonine-protein kinase